MFIDPDQNMVGKVVAGMSDIFGGENEWPFPVSRHLAAPFLG
jgi:hypothetical protein